MAGFNVSNRISIIRASIQVARAQLSGSGPAHTPALTNILDDVDSELQRYQVSSSKEAFLFNHQKSSLTKGTADP